MGIPEDREIKVEEILVVVSGVFPNINETLTHWSGSSENTKQDKYQLFICVYTCMLRRFSRVWLFVTPWTVAHQAPLSMGFSRQEYWSGLLFPSPGNLPDPGIEPRSPALEADVLTSEPPEKPNCSKPKIKTKCLKKQDERRHFTYKRTRIRITVDLSSKTMQLRRWGEILKDWKKKRSILYPEKLSFKSERKIKTFSSKQKLRKSIASRPILQEVLKEVLHIICHERIAAYYNEIPGQTY